MNGTFLTSAASLFLNARFPIITESTSLRFHSAQLGFFPDAGATKLLSSLGGLGMYLGLGSTVGDFIEAAQEDPSIIQSVDDILSNLQENLSSLTE